MSKNLHQKHPIDPRERVALKVKRTSAKISLMKGTGCSILATLKKMGTMIDVARAQGSFPPLCNGCSTEDFMNAK